MIDTGGIQLRLGDFIYGLLKRWKLILALTFIGLLFGLMLSGVSYMQGSYSTYQVDCSFLIVPKSKAGHFTAYNTDYQHSADYDFAATLVEPVMYIIKSDATMNRAIESVRMIGIKPKDISLNLSLNQHSTTPIVEATLSWRDAEEGVVILNAVLKAAQSSIQDIMEVGQLSVINEPAARQSLSGSIGGSVWGYMTVLGFLAGVGFVVLEILMRPTLSNLKDVETVLGMETLGVIPRDDKYFRRKDSLLVEDGIRSPAVTQNYASTAYILRNRLSAMSAPRIFYVTSTLAGEGKSVVAANLAIQLSDMEQKVLLIDMDTRNPTLGKLFLNNIIYDRSLNALYRGDATREDAVFTLTGYLDLLPTVVDRQPIPMDGTIFDLIRDLAKGYDYVIMDTAPVGQISETLSLNAVAKTALFVLRYDTATIPEIRSSLEKLDKSGIRVLGCVVNAAQSVVGAASAEDLDERITQFRNKKSGQLIWEKSEDESAPAEPAKQEQKAKAPKKKGWFRKKQKPEQSKQPEQPPQAQPAGESTVKTAGKDVFADIMEDISEPQPKNLSDSAAADALFRIGVEGAWNDAPEDADPDPAEKDPNNTPSSQTEHTDE